MITNEVICNCKNVTYFDVMDTLEGMDKMEDVISTFNEVQKVTHCSTGCGGCYEKIMDAISDTMM